MQKLKRVVIKEELVALTGSIEGAIILNQMLYWSERVRDFDQFIQEENTRAEKEGIPTSELISGWIYKSADELNIETMKFKSARSIGRTLDMLVEKGYLSRRNNPKYNWDRTYQYRVNLTAIQSGLNELGFALEGYKALNIPFATMANRIDTMASQNDTVANRSVSFGEAIPEITTENTSKITTTDVVGIFRQYGIDIIHVIQKHPNLFSAYSVLEIENIAYTLEAKKKEGKIKNPVGLLLKTNPHEVIEAVLNGTFYPDPPIQKKQYKEDEYEIFSLPMQNI